MTGTSAERRRRLPAVVLAFAASVAATCVGAMELPPEIQADRYLVQAEHQIQAGEHAEAVTTLDKIVALQRDRGLAIPAAFWFKHAQASHDAGRFERAIESATQYLVQAGREGNHYLAALEILDESEQELDAELQREAQERVRHGLDPARSEVELGRSVLSPGETFSDALASGGNGPEMVVIPAGVFRQGCPPIEEYCLPDEQPERTVTIPQAFALSKYEVTFADWDLCVSAGGCNGYRPDDEKWGRGSRPVINVSWNHAIDYVNWLSSEAGMQYRLPSESEWEYSARAGTVTDYHFGNLGDHLCRWGNVADLTAMDWHSGWTVNMVAYCRDGHVYTAPVGSFGSNAFGLHDMHGNVAEWVQDCDNSDYEGAPSDGSAWTSGNCHWGRGVRGGSWASDWTVPRSGYRSFRSMNAQYRVRGFRVARSLLEN